MLGIIVELFISWLLLWLIARKHLSVLGWKPTRNRLAHFGSGFLMAASCCTLFQLMTTAFINNGWVFNGNATGKIIIKSSWWTFVSVIYEELIFRGALLYLLIKKLGVIKACLFSAVCFGMYHWFTFNIFGNPVQMLIVFILTAIVGLAFAMAFAKTKSLYLPIGLHFGWNLINMVVFSNGPLGQPIFIRINENQLNGWPSLLVFLFQLLALPLLTFWYLEQLKNRKMAFSPTAGSHKSV